MPTVGSGKYVDLDFTAAPGAGWAVKKLAASPGQGTPGQAMGLRSDGYAEPKQLPLLGVPSGRLAHGTHLLDMPNGNFEDGLDGWTPANLGTGTTAIDGSTQVTGVNSLRMGVTSVANGDVAAVTSGLFPCGATLPMYVSVRAKLNSGAPVLTATVNFFKATGAANGSTIAIAGFTPTTSFAETFAKSVVPPAGTAYASITLTAGGAVGSLWLDEVRRFRTDTLTNIFGPVAFSSAFSDLVGIPIVEAAKFGVSAANSAAQNAACMTTAIAFLKGLITAPGCGIIELPYGDIYDSNTYLFGADGKAVGFKGKGTTATAWRFTDATPSGRTLAWDFSAGVAGSNGQARVTLMDLSIFDSVPSITSRTADSRTVSMVSALGFKMRNVFMLGSGGKSLSVTCTPYFDMAGCQIENLNNTCMELIGSPTTGAVSGVVAGNAYRSGTAVTDAQQMRGPTVYISGFLSSFMWGVNKIGGAGPRRIQALKNLFSDANFHILYFNAPHNMNQNEPIKIMGANIAAFNGLWNIYDTPDAQSVRIAATDNPGQCTTFGSASSLFAGLLIDNETGPANEGTWGETLIESQNQTIDKTIGSFGLVLDGGRSASSGSKATIFSHTFSNFQIDCGHGNIYLKGARQFGNTERTPEIITFDSPRCVCGGDSIVLNGPCGAVTLSNIETIGQSTLDPGNFTNAAMIRIQGIGGLGPRGVKIVGGHIGVPIGYETNSTQPFPYGILFDGPGSTDITIDGATIAGTTAPVAWTNGADPTKQRLVVGSDNLYLTGTWPTATAAAGAADVWPAINAVANIALPVNDTVRIGGSSSQTVNIGNIAGGWVGRKVDLLVVGYAVNFVSGSNIAAPGGSVTVQPNTWLTLKFDGTYWYPK